MGIGWGGVFFVCLIFYSGYEGEQQRKESPPYLSEGWARVLSIRSELTGCEGNSTICILGVMAMATLLKW
jgi:hypothetical protein